MDCFPELTYSVYADGELPQEEAQRVEAHLRDCARCRALAEGLEGENRILTVAIQEADLPGRGEAAPGARPIDIAWTAAAVLGAALGLQAVLGWVTEMKPPEGVSWLNPLSLAMQMNVFFSSVFYFLEEGTDLLLSNVVNIGLAMLVLLGLTAGWLILRRRPSAAAVLATFLAVFVFAVPASALETRRGSAVTVAEDETVDDSLFVHAETVNIDGTVTGNLFVWARHARIKGRVEGDLFFWCQSLTLDGTVEGNLFVFAQRADLQGHVGQSSHSFAQSLTLRPTAHVSGDVLTFSGETTLDGTVGRDVRAFTGSASVTGKVGRDLIVRTELLQVRSPAQVGGNVRATVKRKKNVQIEAGTVAGETKINLREAKSSRYTRSKFYFWQAVWLAAAFLAGLLLYALFPALLGPEGQTGGSLLRDFGLGFAALVATPIAVIVLAITLVGLPVALIGLALWLVTLYLAKIPVALLVGHSVLRKPGASWSEFAVMLVVGLAILFVAMNVPYLGKVVSFLVVLLGMGMLVYRAWKLLPRRQAAG